MRTGIEILQRHHTRIAFQLMVELCTTDVDGIDAARASFEQNFCKSAGRCSDVQRHGAGRIESKMIERRGELLGTSRNEIRRVLSQLNIRRALYVEGRLVTNKPGHAHKPPPDQILGAGLATVQVRGQQAFDQAAP